MKLYAGLKEIVKTYLGERLVYVSSSDTPTDTPTLTHTEIEYLEGDKVSYINTGVIGKADLTFDIELYTPTTSIVGYTYIMGCSDATYRFYPIAFYGGRFAKRLGSSNWTTGNDGVIKAGDHRFLIKTSTQKDIGIVWGGTTTETMAYYGAWEYVDGELVSRSLNTSAYKVPTETEMYLFAINNNGTASVGNSNFTDTTGYLRIKACKIWDKDINRNDVLIRDYVAVERSDGVKCLYDKVESKYYEFQTA